VPEGLEVELYRRAAEAAVGRRIRAVDVDQRLSADPLAAVLPGARVEAAERIGKLLLLRTDAATLGLHFGMTGRLVVDDHAPIERLEYGAARDDSAWDRLLVRFADDGELRVNDPRRWARFSLDPPTDAFGPDLLSITAAELASALARRRTAVKAVLLDQRAVAGLGNMCVDEVLWQAGLDPARTAHGVGLDEVERIHSVMTEHLPAMLARGGSHTGAISPAVRAALPPCPRDGAPLVRSVVGGRTTVACPAHQR
jgi:formamidopyrimidine-DNA glycosylase